MKPYFVIILLIFSFCKSPQANSESDKTVTYDKKKSTVTVSDEDAIRFKTNGWVHYSDFGALGDGKTDDIDAIANTHNYANSNNLAVKANDGATYYIGSKHRTVVIQTNTDFGSAKFIIDDTNVENHKAPIFTVNSKLKRFKIYNIQSLEKNQKKIDISLAEASLIKVVNSNKTQYIRTGANPTSGKSQTDSFLVDKDGIVYNDTPIIWDFNQITKIMVFPVDDETLYISGGHFTTIANKANSEHAYYERNILIRRSNVIIDGLEHYIINEGSNGAPYRGFLNIVDCSQIIVKNGIFTGHKTYKVTGRAEKITSRGNYDISLNNALKVSFENCSQSNDINDNAYWGIMASNYCKNLVFNNCNFSRIDAHKGVTNLSIKNSTIGYMGVRAIGKGSMLIENSTLHGKAMITLRPDFGSSWQGEILIRNCVFNPSIIKSNHLELISGSNSGQQDFGYTCYLPKRITIENLLIKDGKYGADYLGPSIFNDFNPKLTDTSNDESFPYIRNSEISLKNVTTTSGKSLRLSDNLYFFKDVVLNHD